MHFTKLMVLMLFLATSNSYVNKTLVMVHLVYRHGARSPINFFPNDQYINQWPVNPGMLTKVGMNMEFELGEFLKKRYIVESGFINQSYIAKEVYIRSSDAPRCLQSAETQLAGLYPPIGYQVWNKDINWQPIPIHSVPADTDPVLRPEETDCPHLKELLNQLILKPDYVKKEHENQDFLKLVSNYTGMAVGFNNVWMISDVIICEEAQGFSAPKWYKDIEKQLNELSSWTFLYQYSNVSDELGRLLGGSLLDIINTNMRNFVDKKSYDDLYKLTMFSGHDVSILALTAALDVDITPPTFASCFMIEMYKDSNGNFFVEMQFRNDTSGKTFPIKLRHCNNSCPLEQFLSLTSKRTTKTQDCFGQKHESSFLTLRQLKSLLFIFMILTLLLVISLLVVLIRKRKIMRRLNYLLKDGAHERLLSEI